MMKLKTLWMFSHKVELNRMIAILTYEYNVNLPYLHILHHYIINFSIQNNASIRKPYTVRPHLIWF